MKECPQCEGSGIERDMTVTDEQGHFDSKRCEQCFGDGWISESLYFAIKWNSFIDDLIYKPIRPYLEKLNDWLTRKN